MKGIDTLGISPSECKGDHSLSGFSRKYCCQNPTFVYYVAYNAG